MKFLEGTRLSPGSGDGDRIPGIQQADSDGGERTFGLNHTV
ncbi:hypothetical protein [Laspinema palackyanum]